MEGFIEHQQRAGHRIARRWAQDVPEQGVPRREDIAREVNPMLKADLNAAANEIHCVLL